VLLDPQALKAFITEGQVLLEDLLLHFDANSGQQKLVHSVLKKVNYFSSNFLDSILMLRADSFQRRHWDIFLDHVYSGDLSSARDANRIT
jgi:hypothetical protein